MLKRIIIFLIIGLMAFASPVSAIKYKGDLEANESVTFPEQGTTPSNPPAAKHKLYFKSDGNVYKLNPGGAETQVDGGGGGSSSWTDGGVFLNPNTNGDGIELRDATGVDNVRINHNGTNAVIISNTGLLQINNSIVFPGTETVDGRDLSVDGSKLDGISAGAEVNPPVVSQADAEAGTSTTETTWTAQRVKQAVDALSGGVILGTKQATTSGTTFDFTGLPAGVKRVMISFEAVSLNTSASDVLIQLGDSGGFETTGYTSDSVSLSSTGSVGGGTDTTGFIVHPNLHITEMSGIITLTRMDGSALWVESHTLSTGHTIFGGGKKTLSAELTQIRITATGIGTFDNGSINIMYE